MYSNLRSNIVTSNATTNSTGRSSVGVAQCTTGMTTALGIQLSERGSEAAAGGCAATWTGGVWGALAAAMLLLVGALTVF